MDKSDKLMTLLPDTDLHRAWQIIDRINSGEIYELAKIPEARRELFIRCIKQRHDTIGDIYFNSDYTKIKKIIPTFNSPDWNRDQKT
jgi:hypothetical protein